MGVTASSFGAVVAATSRAVAVATSLLDVVVVVEGGGQAGQVGMYDHGVPVCGVAGRVPVEECLRHQDERVAVGPLRRGLTGHRLGQRGLFGSLDGATVVVEDDLARDGHGGVDQGGVLGRHPQREDDGPVVLLTAGQSAPDVARG